MHNESPDDRSTSEIFLGNNYNYDKSILPVMDQIVLDFIANNYSFDIIDGDNRSLILKVCRKFGIGLDDFYKKATGAEYHPRSMGAFEEHLGNFIRQRYAATT